MAEIVDPLLEQSWDGLIAGRPGALFQSQDWMRVLAQTYDFDFRASVERNSSGELTSGLPFAYINDLRGKRIVMLPFSDFLVPATTGVAQWRSLVQPLIDAGVQVKVQTFQDSNALQDDRFVVAKICRHHSISLDADISELVRRFRPLPRRSIRASEAAGLTFRAVEDPAHLRAFFDLHLGVRKNRHQLLAQPYALFENLWKSFVEQGAGALILGFDGEVVAGGCLLLEFDGVLYYKFAASHPEYRSVGVSHAAVHASMIHGLEHGCSALDLGRSDIGQPGLIDFKRRFGAEESDLHSLTLKNSPPEQGVEAARIVSEITRLFVRESTPDQLTEHAGDLLYRLFA